MAELKKQLGLLDTFSVAAGAMISSGLFVLPAIAFQKAGPAMILSYLFASILIVPSVLSQAELSTAMPKAGGSYFFVERSLGAFGGIFTGFANWFSLALKSAFAIVGMAVFIQLFFKTALNVEVHPWHLKFISAVCCIFFTALNIVSVKHATRFQVVLVFIMLAILTVFIVLGAKNIDPVRFKGFFDKGYITMFATTGLVFISFGGLTHIASVGEEIKDPGKNLPLGMMLAWFFVTIIYFGVVTVTVGVTDAQSLIGNYAPISFAAERFMQKPGFVLLTIAAIAAFVTTANGGILAASRSPLAMSRDRLLPNAIASISPRFKTPHISVIITGGFMILSIIFLDLENLVKTASTLIIILFILANLSVIIMRESKIQSYRPKFRSPLYPYLHITTVIIYTVLIIEMGKVPLLISACFIALSATWFKIYVAKRVSRASAVMHIVERITDREIKTVTLENELRDILIQRDDIVADRFDRLIINADIIDVKGNVPAEKIFRKVSVMLAEKLNTSEYVLFEKFIHRETEGSTVVQPGLAIPHIIVDGENKFDIILIRAVDGIVFPHAPEPIKIMFILVGSKDQRNYHLRALMAIAQITQEKNFKQKWLAARDTEAIRNLLLLSTRKRETGK